MLDAIQLNNSTFVAEIRSISSIHPEFTVSYREGSNVHSVGYYKVLVRIEQWIYSSAASANFDSQLPNLPFEERAIFVKTESDNPNQWIGPVVGEKFIFILSRSIRPSDSEQNICIGKLDISEKSAVIHGIAKSIRKQLTYTKKWLDWNFEGLSK